MSSTSFSLPISKDLLLIYTKVNERRRQLRTKEKAQNHDGKYQKYSVLELQDRFSDLQALALKDNK